MKNVFSLLLCLALLFCLALPAGAEQQAGFLHPMVWMEGDFLYLAAAPAEGGTVTVTANGQSLPCTVTTAREAELPITYYCMMDQSSSFSDSQKKQQLRALTALNEALRPIDTLVLYRMGEELSVSDPLTTKEARTQAIKESCVYSARFTDLNAFITYVADAALKSQDSRSLGCIMLITDGLDNAHIKVSREALVQAIRQSCLSLCALPVVDPWGGEFAQTNASRMVEYAEQSVGGMGLVPSRINFDSPTGVEEAMDRLVEQMLSGAVIRLEASSLAPQGDYLELEVTLDREGVRLTDKCSISAELLPERPQPETTQATTEPTTEAATEAATETATETTTEATQPAATQTTQEAAPQPAVPAEQGGIARILVFILIGLAALAVLCVLLLLLLRSRKEKEPPLEEPEDIPLPPVPPAPAAQEKKADFPSMDELKKRLKLTMDEAPDLPPRKAEEPEPPFLTPDPLPQPEPRKTEAAPREPEKAPEIPAAQKPAPRRPSLFAPKITPPAGKPLIPQEEADKTPGCRVRLEPEEYPLETREFTIGVNESVTLGRNSRSDVILNENDHALSSLHFELQWDSRALHLRDRNSTNGTALNGVPLRPEVWTRVENKAVIQAGSDRYTLFLKKK